jgi:RES domain-containing protein
MGEAPPPLYHLFTPPSARVVTRAAACDLALDVMTAIKEANQGFASKMAPCVLCRYDVACDDVSDLRTASRSNATPRTRAHTWAGACSQ